MYFGIYGEKEVDSITLNGIHPILIRICGHYDLKTSNCYDNILNLNIEDMPLECVNINFKIHLISEFTKLNNFILQNEFDEVIVHCAAGLSRSPAIMICIARILNSRKLEEFIKEQFKLYNKAIVYEFTNYYYREKDVKIDSVIFKGHFVESESTRQIEEKLEGLYIDNVKEKFMDSSDGIVSTNKKMRVLEK